jgi:hypothetical protein
VSVPVTEIRCFGAGVTDGKTGELRAGPAQGDLTKGAHGTFIRMPAGFVSPAHLHTGDGSSAAARPTSPRACRRTSACSSPARTRPSTT